MTETEATVKILDHIGKRIRISGYSTDISWAIPAIELFSIGEKCFVIGLHKKGFVMNIQLLLEDPPWVMTGFELLETIADRYPSVAKLLAEPIE